MTLLLLVGLSVSTSPDPDAMNGIGHFRKGVELRGNADLARPEFAQAAAAFDQFPPRFPAATLYRARAHRLAGDLPRAILALREGLAATPADRDLQKDLASARAAVTYPVGSELATQCQPRVKTSLATLLSPLQATFAGGSLWLLVCLAGTRYLMTREGRWLALAGISLTLLLVFAGFLWHGEREVKREREQRIAVIAEDVLLRTGNATSFATVLDATLPRGVEVKVVGERGGWRHVELAGGLQGWVPNDATVP